MSTQPTNPIECNEEVMFNMTQTVLANQKLILEQIGQLQKEFDKLKNFNNSVKNDLDTLRLRSLRSR